MGWVGLSINQSNTYLIDSESLRGIQLLFLHRLGYQLNTEQFKTVFSVLVKLVDLDLYLCHDSFGVEDLGLLETLIKRFSNSNKHQRLKLIVDEFHSSLLNINQSSQLNFYYSLKVFFGEI